MFPQSESSTENLRSESQWHPKVFKLPDPGIFDGGFYPSPAAGTNGTVYVGSFDQNLYAINPDGTISGNSQPAAP